jgi:hypothetical protein
MHASLKTIDSLSLKNHLAGELGNAATSAPCNIDKLGTEVVHAIHTIIKVLNTLGGLGREVLEREGGLATPLRLAEHVLDMHNEGNVWETVLLNEFDPRPVGYP